MGRYYSETIGWPVGLPSPAFVSGMDAQAVAVRLARQPNEKLSGATPKLGRLARCVCCNAAVCDRWIRIRSYCLGGVGIGGRNHPQKFRFA